MTARALRTGDGNVLRYEKILVYLTNKNEELINEYDE